MNDRDVALARLYWSSYRLRGLNPIPSCPTEKKPLLKFVERWGWGTMLPEETFERFPTSNLQVLTGRPWRLLVIDLDGEESRREFFRRAKGRLPSDHWMSHSGGNGMHLWFGIPSEGPDLPKAVLWKGDGPHSAIERLGDRSMVVAPPSIHPKTGRRYEFADRRHSPLGAGRPGPAPAWLLAWPAIRSPRPAVRLETRPVPFRRAGIAGPGRLDRDAVLAAVPDKVGLARRWGLRVVSGRPSLNGWVACHAIGREDARPSAAIHVTDGIYVDRGTDVRMSFFDLAVALGAYGSWRDAVADLGEANHVGRAG